MGASKRDESNRLKLRERLLEPGIPRTSFFTAVRWLERLATGQRRIGGAATPVEEGISFKHSPSLSSQPNELCSIEYLRQNTAPEQLLDEPQHKFEVTTCLLGLSGHDSPLPPFYMEELVQQDPDAELKVDFLDLFHNRLTALFYRTVTKYHFPGEFDSNAMDPGSARLLALAGFDVDKWRGLGVVSRLELMRVGALFAEAPCTARSLENAVRELLKDTLEGVPLGFEQFTGGWVTVDPSQHNHLGRDNNEMAETFMIGTRVRHPAHKARFTVGPMDPDQARKFRPNGLGFFRLKGLVESLSSSPVQFDVQLIVNEGGYPPFVLGTRKLRRDTYITGRPEDSRLVKYVYPLAATS